MKNKIDYTPYYIDAEKKLKDIHEALKRNNYNNALLLLDDLFAEVRLMQIAVKSHVE